MKKSNTKTLEIDDEVISAVAKKASKSIKVPTAAEIAESLAAKMETTKKKNIHTGSGKLTKSKKSDMEAMPKELRFAKAVRAFKNNDGAAIAEYNTFVDKAWQDVNKANYQNVTTTADGGALVPDPEFIAEVERLTDDYGTASRLATIRRTDRDSVTLLKGTNEVSFTRTSEATAANAQKLTYGAATAALDKYIATLVMTSEVVEDAAIDIFQDATNEIARARAKLFDELTFTDSTYGLLSAAAGDTYKTVGVGSALSDFDADDAIDAIYKVNSSARRNGKFFMHPTVWNEMRTRRIDEGGGAGTGGYLFGGPGQSVTPNIDGYPVELVDILPDAGDITANEPFAVFGDLSRVLIHVKRLLETKVFDSGVVKDAGGTDINLITQDSWAMRATLRAVPQTRFEGAFVIIGTGTVS